MSTVVSLELPWGRYHATEWGKSVNEANPEWPPSPWRFLRALYATWRSRAPELGERDVASLLEALSEPPAFRLPRRSVAHTRHYMPDSSHGTDKVLDSFNVVERGAEILLRWEQDLSEAQKEVLDRLCSLLGYLGRAETICTARVVSDDDPGFAGHWIEPQESKANAHADLGFRPSRCLAPDTPLDLPSLLATTSQVRRAGLVVPPGARWVSYPISEDAPTLTGGAPRRRSMSVTATTAVLALDASVRPSIHDTVWMADALRMAALSQHQDPSASLAGKDELGQPLQGHGHAHYFPLDLDGDRMLDTLAVWCPCGLRSSELEAISNVNRLFSRVPGFRPVRVALQAFGSLDRVAPELAVSGRRWVSTTPFVPYRHRKRQSELAFLEAEVSREAEARGLPAVHVERVIGGDWLDYRRARLGRQATQPTFGLAVTFDDAVTGPVSLGSLSHFGLGRFTLAGA